MSFKDINELVEQNVHLRSHVLRLSSEIENKEEELKVNIKFLNDILDLSFPLVFVIWSL